MASYVCASQSRARAGGDHLVEIHHPAPPPADRRAAGLHPRSVFSIRAFFRSFCDRHSTKRFVAEQDLAREIPVSVGGRGGGRGIGKCCIPAVLKGALAKRCDCRCQHWDSGRDNRVDGLPPQAAGALNYLCDSTCNNSAPSPRGGFRCPIRTADCSSRT